MVVVDKEYFFVVLGSGEVVELDDNIAVIGFGGLYVLAAVRVFLQNIDFFAVEIVKKVLEIAVFICVYINNNIIVLELQVIRYDGVNFLGDCKRV